MTSSSSAATANLIKFIACSCAYVGINVYMNRKRKQIYNEHEACIRKNGIDYEIDVDDDNMLEACARIVDEWRNDPPLRSSMNVIMVKGGITNKLYRVCDSNGFSVLVRIYGEKTDLLINRSLENRVFSALTERSFGPPLLGCFKGGRIEGWLNAHTLKPDELQEPYYRDRIARELARMHALDIPGISHDITLWSTIAKWLNIVRDIAFEDDEELSRKYKSFFAYDDIVTDIETIWKSMLKPVSEPVVFCHNDLLAGNILHDSETDTIYFVDFEYGSYNTRGFDIANHFCEYCGYDLNWSDFPTSEQMHAFIREYLNTNDDKCVDKVYDEVCYWIPMPHLFWGLWAIVQARYSTIDFDFLEYAQLRFEGYNLEKEKIIKLKENRIGKRTK